MRANRLLSLWAAFFLMAFGAWVVLVLRIGPVIAVVDARHGHGVHTGDFIGVLAAMLGLPRLAAAAVAPRR